MTRFLREVPAAVARQALVNKTVNAADLERASQRPAPSVSESELELLASEVTAPELLPYEYAYVDVYADGRGKFYVALLDRYHRRSVKHSLAKG